MSLFSWLSSGKKPAKPIPQPDSSGLSRMESTKPYPGRGGAEPNGRPANRKSERMARRELLYAVVRDSMAKSGVVSASYKFKVLSLDARGRQFLVMVDLAREYGNDASGLAEIEAMIAQSAKARFDIIVTAVYWRMNEHVAVGMHTGGVLHKPAASQSATAQALPTVSQPAPLESTAPAAPLSRTGSRFEPIASDEVAAFKKALAAGVSGEAALQAAGGAVARDFGGNVHHGPQSYTLLTGFEDTELCEDGQPATGPGALSATQYGDLR